MNFAQLMAEVSEKPVHLFDMDQTKGLFRTRDVSELLEEKGIIVHSQKQLLDAPTIVPGVIETLTDPDAYVLMDIGGNATPIGASANVVGTSIAAKSGHPISWAKYCKVMAPATVIVVVISMLLMFVRYF